MYYNININVFFDTQVLFGCEFCLYLSPVPSSVTFTCTVSCSFRNLSFVELKKTDVSKVKKAQPIALICRQSTNTSIKNIQYKDYEENVFINVTQYKIIQSRTSVVLTKHGEIKSFEKEISTVPCILPLLLYQPLVYQMCIYKYMLWVIKDIIFLLLYFIILMQ